MVCEKNESLLVLVEGVAMPVVLAYREQRHNEDMVHQIRRKLRNIRSLRSAFHFYLAVRERAQWSKKLVLDEWLNQMYEKPDPWNYTSCPEEQDRFRSAAHLVDDARDGKLFEHAFEVGCAEGVFTAMLTTRCKSLLAVDLSKTALNRAKDRCAGMNVRFDQWDLALSPTPTGMDLVVIMDVLELFFRPADVRNARDKLVGAIRPGGFLLLGNSRQNDIYETALWGKWMLRGGKRIVECFAEHPRLALVRLEAEGLYVNALFRAKANCQVPM